MLSREEILKKLDYVLSSAWESRNPIRLENLPYSGEFTPILICCVPQFAKMTKKASI